MTMNKPILFLWLLLATSTHAFIPPNTQTHHPITTSLQMTNTPSRQTRRTFGISLLTTALPLLTTTTNPSPSHAYVFVDPDRYGDKELKIATVNKLRQNIRDAILQKPSLAPLFLKVAIQDAVTYDVSTGENGPDGTILNAILDPNAPESLASLKPAAEALKGIATKIKKQTEVTLADIVAFAGAEAIETAGGPRIVVQLGKLDPKGGGQVKASYPDLCGKTGSEEVVQAFLKAGLTEREVALLYGAIGAMEMVADSVQVEEEEEEENEMGDKEVFIPTSFGAPKEIYGKRLGAMDGSIYKMITNDLKQKKRPIADVFLDDKVGGWANKYAGNKSAFLKDLPEAYGKLMSLGTRYTGGKVGSLLGKQEDS